MYAFFHPRRVERLVYPFLFALGLLLTAQSGLGQTNAFLDTTFAQNGYVNQIMEGRRSHARACLVQADKKIVVAHKGDYSTFEGYFVLNRYWPNGVEDSTFGKNGRIFIPKKTDPIEQMDLQTLPDGGLVFLHSEIKRDPGSVPLENTIYVYAFDKNGQTNTIFNTAGVTKIDIKVPEHQIFKLHYAQGKITVLIQNIKNFGQTLLRLNANGLKDYAFNGGEPVVLSDTHTASMQMYVAPDQSVYTAYLSNQQPGSILVKHYLPNGKLDASYGTNGSVAFIAPFRSEGLTAITLDTDNNLLLGHTYSPTSFNIGFAINRLKPTGEIDNAFGDNGWARIDNDDNLINRINVLSNGFIFAVGSVLDVNTFQSRHSMLLLTPNGKNVAGFGDNGRLTTPFLPGASSEAFDIALQEGEFIITAGYVQPSTNSLEITHSLVARFDLAPVLRPFTAVAQLAQGPATLALSPNPFHDHLRVELDVAKPAQVLSISLNDMQGKCIKTFAAPTDETLEKFVFDLNALGNLPVGAYILQVLTSEGVVSKLIKNNIK